MATTKNLHIPIPIQWHEKLKELANLSNSTATELVRSAIIEFIKNQEKKAIDDAIIKFASEYGGTEFDIDPALEETSLESLRNN
ncbi:MAG: hypothetical protein ACK4IX_02010 [Candidatus Sericytochromatia bacterium]